MKTSKITELNKLYTQTDVAEMIGITPAHFRYRILAGVYPAPTRERKVRQRRQCSEARKFYSESDLHEVIEAHNASVYGAGQ